MLNLPDSLRAKLTGGETTLCHCWQITPRFGGVLGFTDHDCDLQFEGVEFEASSGFQASGIERELGLSIDNATATGALRSERITENDIRHGRFDGAEVHQWLVDWSDPDDRVLVFRGEIGDISRSGKWFEAELRGLAERLNRTVGRKFLHVCDASLGDDRCGVDLTAESMSAEIVVAGQLSARSFVCTTPDSTPLEAFAGGVVHWSTGANEGQSGLIRALTGHSLGTCIEVDRDFLTLPQVGDALTITRGCDKRKETCRAKFNNLDNFRGFPFMPGESWITAYPTEGDVHDGGSQSGG